jgi:hypothetical protein
MHNDNEEKKHALVLAQQPKTLELARKALGRSGLDADAGNDILSPSPVVGAEVRSVRRGKFFLSNQEQARHGSLRYPIFEHWGHGVVVGEMRSHVRENEDEPEGMWCFGAHNDFDLIPEFMKPSEWPEYIRTPTGWMRKDGDRRIREERSRSVDKLIERIQDVKRLL